jgi:nucleotide-binding universal stress UspA family protein
MKNPNILVPTDFSDLSKKAMHIANDVANLLDGKVTPFHSYIPITDMDGFHYMNTGAGTEKNLTDIEDSLKQRIDDISGEYIDAKRLEPGIIGIGNPAHAIVESSIDYDLIIMSTHGRTGFKRFLLGSVAEKVLRMSNVPVLVVEDQTHFSPMQRILVTTDFSDNAKAAYPIARDFAEASGADVELFHAVLYDNFDSLAKAESTYDMRQENLERIAMEYFPNLKGKVHVNVVMTNRSAHETIMEQTQKELYNMVVMSTIGRTGLDYLMLGSTTSNVARLTNSAVLSVNPEKTASQKKKAIIEDMQASDK